MDLLLTHGYFLQEDPKELLVMKPYVPLGILYLSSHLRAQGFDVEIYDSTFGSREDLYALLDAGPPSAIGIYGNLMTRRNVVEIAQRAHASGWTVIVGGPEPPNYAEEYLANGADVVVQGEGEIAVESVLRMLRGHRQLTPDLPGIIYRDAQGAIVHTPAAPLIANLDAQPWPDRERVDIARYLKAWRDHHGLGSVSLITARGCPYHCRWCSHSVYGKTHRRRSPRSVADEAEAILNRYQPDMLWYADDVFTIHPGWIFEYAAEMKRRGIRVPFECITRADRMNPRITETLAELGCFRIWIGSESGSQRILDAMQRGVTIQQVRTAVALAKQNSIQTGMFFMWGYEGEQMADIEATAEHVKACRPDVFFTTVSYPIKGTPYYDEVAPKLVSLNGWTQRTDRDFQIRARHSRRFYHYADELLHGEVEADAVKAAAARQGLRETFHEVEA